jgi:hypothetical protein
MERIKKASNQFEKDIRFMKWRWIGSVLIIVSLVIALVVSFSQKDLLVVDKQGNVYRSEKTFRTDKRVLYIEADAHVRAFYKTFWSFDHNSIELQFRKAAHLGGKCVNDLYEDLQNKGFYNDVRLNGYYIDSEVDSTDTKTFSFDGSRVFIKAWGTSYLRNELFEEKRKLEIEFELKLTDRVVADNPNGFSIEKLNIVDNSTIK